MFGFTFRPSEFIIFAGDFVNQIKHDATLRRSNTIFI